MYDREGLFLLVDPRRSKLWRWRYWVDGKDSTRYGSNKVMTAL
jgi:hypothetical protein